MQQYNNVIIQRNTGHSIRPRGGLTAWDIGTHYSIHYSIVVQEVWYQRIQDGFSKDSSREDPGAVLQELRREAPYR